MYARSAERKPEDEVPNVVFPPLTIEILVLRMVAAQREVLLPDALHYFLHLVERPVPRKARLDLSQDAKPVERSGLKLLNGNVLNWRFVIAER